MGKSISKVLMEFGVNARYMWASRPYATAKIVQDVANSRAANEMLDKVQRIVSDIQPLYQSTVYMTAAAVTIFPPLVIYLSIFILNLLQRMWFGSKILNEMFSYGNGFAMTVPLVVIWLQFGLTQFAALICVCLYFVLMVVDSQKLISSHRQGDILITFKLLFTASIGYALYFLYNHPTIKNLQEMDQSRHEVSTENTGNCEDFVAQNDSGSNRISPSVPSSVQNSPVASTPQLNASNVTLEPDTSNVTLEPDTTTQSPQVADAGLPSTPQSPPLTSIRSSSDRESMARLETTLTDSLPSNTHNTTKGVTSKQVDNQENTQAMDDVSKKDKPQKKKIMTRKQKKAEKRRLVIQEEIRRDRELQNNPFRPLFKR